MMIIIMVTLPIILITLTVHYVYNDNSTVKLDVTAAALLWDM